MARIDIDSLQSGMRLSSDVRDITGRLLLKAGEVIEGRHLYIFRAWGVTEAEVAVDRDQPDASSPDTGDAALRAGIETELRRIFRHTDLEMSFMKELFQLAVARRVKIMSGDEI